VVGVEPCVSFNEPLISDKGIKYGKFGEPILSGLKLLNGENPG